MPYSKEHKRQTRARIVECARRLFNRRGFEGVSIDEIMQAAGLTRGGFYNHFDSKDDLYAEVLDAFACRARPELEPGSGSAPDRREIERAHRLVDGYVSPQLLGEVERHCPLIALPSDVARSGPTARAAYRNLFSMMAALFESSARHSERENARELGLGVASTCVGAMILARTVDDQELAREICEAARMLAHDMLGQDEG